MNAASVLVKSACLVSALCIVSSESFAQGGLPVGWRMASEAKAFSVEADFNGDGKRDRAVLITNGASTKLLAFVSEGASVRSVELLDLAREPYDVDLVEVLPPGRYQTACGKRYFECQPGEPREIEADRPLLRYSNENVTIVFPFKNGMQSKIWLSD